MYNDEYNNNPNPQPKENTPAEPQSEEMSTIDVPAAGDTVVPPEMELPEIPASAPAEPQVQVPAPLPLYDPPKFERKREGSSFWRRLAAVAAIVALSAGVGSGSTYYLMKNQQPTTPIGYVQPPSMQSVAQTVSEVGASVIPAIYNRVSPSVVSISVSSGQGFYRTAGSGSGFVVDASGYILTNYHVIEDARSITVKFIDGTTLQAQVVGRDKSKDLAVVKVDPGNRSLVAATLGDSDQVQVGELAVAIGNPYGHEFTVTAGIVSALDREIVEEAAVSIPGAIQTDAAINPGNSGGPLLNSRGEVIGINTAIEAPDTVRSNIGLGFAVPINLAKDVLPSLMAGETIQRPFLGVSLTDMNSRYARLLGSSTTTGALVYQVEPGSAAEKAGIRSAEIDEFGLPESADVIVGLNDQEVRSSSDLIRLISQQKVGDTVTLKVVRGSETIILTATLGGRTDDE